MDEIEPRTLAEIIASTSTSKLAGLLAADAPYKRRAAERLAHDILCRLKQPQQDHNQLSLPL
jgi:hypothetical protein